MYDNSHNETVLTVMLLEDTGYKPVAMIRVYEEITPEALRRIYLHCQNDGGSWLESSAVTPLVPECRSLTPGDIVVGTYDTAWRVRPNDWKEIKDWKVYLRLLHEFIGEGFYTYARLKEKFYLGEE